MADATMVMSMASDPESGKYDAENSMTKLLCGMCLVAAVVSPGFGRAGEQRPDAKPLATAEAVLEYCEKFDPPSAARYREQVKQLERGASEEGLAKVRKSDEYRQARGQVVDFLAQVDERNAKKVCARRPGQTQ